MNRFNTPSQQSKLSKKLIPTSLILLGIVLVVLMPLAIWVAYGPMPNQTSAKAIGSSNNIIFPLMSAGLMTMFSIAVLNRYISSKKMYFFSGALDYLCLVWLAYQKYTYLYNGIAGHSSAGIFLEQC